MIQYRRGRFSPALVLFLLLFLLQAGSAWAQKWSFAVFSDNRNFEVGYHNVLEQMNSGAPADPNFPKPDFVIGIGDIDPVEKTLQLFREVMGPEVPFIPVRGNHEAPVDSQLIIKNVLPSLAPPVVLYDNSSASFYYDWKNVRLIVIDQYAPYTFGSIDRNFLKWLEEAITSANNADHVFISFHEPRLPPDFDLDPLWGLMLKHSDKVRAVLCGHTHTYGRRYFTNRQGGIEYINAGNAGNTGHGDKFNTFIQISVDKKQVDFRCVQARDKTNNFEVSDAWQSK